VLDKILYKKREYRFQITLNSLVIFMICFKAFDKFCNVGKLVLNEDKVRMLEVLDDQIDRVGA
jgi:hypothetical protein